MLTGSHSDESADRISPPISISQAVQVASTIYKNHRVSASCLLASNALHSVPEKKIKLDIQSPDRVVNAQLITEMGTKIKIRITVFEGAMNG